MGYGLQVRGEHGILQIDGLYKNMSLYKKATFSLPGGSEGSSSWGEYGKWVHYPFTAPPESLLAFIPSQYCVVNFDLGGIEQLYGSPAGQCEIFCFTGDNTHYFQSTYGVQVRNPNTLQEVFNSNWVILRIVDVFNLEGGASGWKYTIPNGKKYAIAVGGGMKKYTTNGERMYGDSTCFKISDNTFHIDVLRESWWYRDEDEKAYTASLFGLSILIIDVTGY